MCPSFGQLAALVGEAVEQCTVVQAEPRKEHLVVRRDDDVDEIELKQAEPPDHTPEVAKVDTSTWSRPVESLRCECDPARF